MELTLNSSHVSDRVKICKEAREIREKVRHCKNSIEKDKLLKRYAYLINELASKPLYLRRM